MKIVVDLNKCQSYGQCIFAAPTVFRWHSEEALEFNYNPDDSLRQQVEQAALACPVQAIFIDRSRERIATEQRPGERAGSDEATVGRGVTS